jgi:hypothetical protein
MATTKIRSSSIEDGQVSNADLSATIAVTGGQIADDAVTLAKMAGLARGKIIVGDSSGDPSALTVGASTQVLTSDGTDASWAAAATTAVDFVKIHTLTASDDSDLTFSSTYVTSDYKQVIFTCYDIVPATDTTQFKVQFSDDNGVSYDSSFVGSFFYSYKISTDTHYAASTAYGTYNADHATLAFDLSNVSNHGLGGELRVQNPGGTTNIKTWQFVGSHITHDATPKMYSETLGGYFNNNAAINNVKFLMASGNITSGSIALWGMK